VEEEERDVFFGSILPRIINLALALPTTVTHAVPLLKKQQNYSITLSQQQIACLLANAFLCTFPRRNATQAHSEYAKYITIHIVKLTIKNNNYVVHHTETQEERFHHQEWLLH